MVDPSCLAASGQTNTSSRVPLELQTVIPDTWCGTWTAGHPDPDTDLALDASDGVAKVLTGIKVIGAGLADDLGVRIDSKAAGAGPDGAMGA